MENLGSLWSNSKPITKRFLKRFHEKEGATTVGKKFLSTSGQRFSTHSALSETQKHITVIEQPLFSPDLRPVLVAFKSSA